MKVTRENLADAVKQALSLCAEQLAADGKVDLQGLQVARQALELIAPELSAGEIRARQPRSRMFSRYVLDEGPRVGVDPALRDFILEIENIYRRM